MIPARGYDPITDSKVMSPVNWLVSQFAGLDPGREAEIQVVSYNSKKRKNLSSVGKINIWNLQQIRLFPDKFNHHNNIITLNNTKIQLFTVICERPFMITEWVNKIIYLKPKSGRNGSQSHYIYIFGSLNKQLVNDNNWNKSVNQCSSWFLLLRIKLTWCSSCC